MRLLLIEDDVELLTELKKSLVNAGFVVDTSSNGKDAEFLGDTETYDAIILDLGLPERSGLAVLANWRERGNDVPVLILTARSAWHEKVKGFHTGADDYLAKPFHTEELIARMHALIRRRYGKSSSILTIGKLSIDADRRCAITSEGDHIDLTETEFRLLEYLMLNSGSVVSKTNLLDHTYSSNSDVNENLIEVYINRLRSKLGSGVIETRRGQGYIFKKIK